MITKFFKGLLLALGLTMIVVPEQRAGLLDSIMPHDTFGRFVAGSAALFVGTFLYLTHEQYELDYYRAQRRNSRLYDNDVADDDDATNTAPKNNALRAMWASFTAWFARKK